MRQLKFTLWAIGNILLAAFVILISWASAYPIALLLDGAWPLALLLALVIPVGTVLWPGWLLGQGAMSIALVRLANRRKGRLAHLSYDRHGSTIELDTNDPGVAELHDLGLALLLPGWGGVFAAYLLTVSGGLAIAGPTVFHWPLWASALFLVPWAAGWIWYAMSVRARR